tara:strand:- start:255 stop:449 length:195 start_codon:yes stop_codon:yes gene_type:complete
MLILVFWVSNAEIKKIRRAKGDKNLSIKLLSDVSLLNRNAKKADKGFSPYAYFNSTVSLKIKST